MLLHPSACLGGVEDSFVRYMLQSALLKTELSPARGRGNKKAKFKENCLFDSPILVISAVCGAFIIRITRQRSLSPC
jgi:hypothetical protein